MPAEIVSVQVGGTNYGAWEHVSVKAGVKEAARSFVLRAAAAFGPQAVSDIFAPGTALTITSNGDLIFTGFIDKRHRHIDPRIAYFTVTGRSKGQDAVDSSALHKTGNIKDKDPLEIAKELDKSTKTKVGFSSDGTKLKKVPNFQLQPGETIFRCIERLCRDQGVTMMGTPEGGIKITKAGANAKRQSGALIEGVNMEFADSYENMENRHSDVIVRGQSYSGSGKDALQIEHTAKDQGVKRERPVVWVYDGDASKEKVKDRAENHRDKAAGEGLKADVTTATWRDESGTLWTPGNKVWVESSFLGLAQDMLIETVRYSQDPHRDQCHLGLVDPRAHGGDGKGVNKSGVNWNF
jgi:prophage tail gpP-like protein